METVAPPPRELPIVAGHLALDFANTVDDPLGPARHDHASTYDDRVRWSLRVGTVTDAQASTLHGEAGKRPQAARAALRGAHDLRRVLNKAFGAIVEGEVDLSPAWTRLRTYVAAAEDESDLRPASAGHYVRVWPRADDLAVVLHPVATSAAALLVSTDLDRLKRCARCPWLFLDHSKNHSRRWCDMNDCGRAQKIERYVARRSARRRRPD